MDVLLAMSRSMPWADEAACYDSERDWVPDPNGLGDTTLLQLAKGTKPPRYPVEVTTGGS